MTNDDDDDDDNNDDDKACDNAGCDMMCFKLVCAHLHTHMLFTCGHLHMWTRVDVYVYACVCTLVWICSVEGYAVRFAFDKMELGCGVI